MDHKLFATALGLSEPWFITGLDFNEGERRLTVRIDFRRGTRFAYDGDGGTHPVHDTQTKRYRHLNFFQHECELETRIPRVRLPDGRVVLISPPWAGRRAGFTLLFEALVIALCRQMPFAAAARLAGLSPHRARSICECYVDLAREDADLSTVCDVAIDETSRARGHDYVTAVADAVTHRVVFVGEGRGKAVIGQFAEELAAHGGDPEEVDSVSIDMSPAFIQGVAKHLPNAQITFDKFHVMAHASRALDQTRRAEQRKAPALKGLRWTLLRNPASLNPEQRADLNALATRAPGRRTARAWLYREQLREILNRKQINVARAMLHQWCTNVNRSKVKPMKDVAATIRRHIDGIAAWARTRRTNGFMEALNGLFQSAKRKARGYCRFETIRTVFFLLAGKLDFSGFNPHAA